MHTLYGISNCDTVKKARDWLEQHGLAYQFIDIRKTPINTARLKDWGYTAGWEVLVNKRSRTWRELSAKDKDNLSEQKTLKLIQKYPTLLKRPVLEIDSDDVLIGFNEKQYAQLLQR